MITDSREGSREIEEEEEEKEGDLFRLLPLAQCEYTVSFRRKHQRFFSPFFK